MYNTEYIPLLELALKGTLPGKEAQYLMSRFGRSGEIPDSFRHAAVLILLFPKDDILHFILTRRSSRFENDKHSGQISFPGGSKEDADPDLAFTALRENYEEIGVPVNDIRLIGQLTELYIPVSNFLVSPFIGYTDHQPVYIPQEDEVEEVIEVPLELFMDASILATTDMPIYTGAILKDIPYYDLYGHVVWGATAMMLSEFRSLISQITAEKS